MKVFKIMYDKFIGAHVEFKEFDGEYQEHICIPLRPNGLRKSKGGHIVGSFSVNRKKRIDVYNNTSYVSVYTTKNVWSAAKRLNRDTDLKYIGQVHETKDYSNPFAKVINMGEEDMSEIKALDRIYKNIKSKDEEVEEE